MSGTVFPQGFIFDHRILAAFLAIATLFCLFRLLALATPPLSPPSLPSATAAGFFAEAVPVDCWTMLNAVSFKSDLLERLGMKQHPLSSCRIQVQSEISGFKLYHYLPAWNFDKKPK